MSKENEKLKEQNENLKLTLDFAKRHLSLKLNQILKQTLALRRIKEECYYECKACDDYDENIKCTKYCLFDDISKIVERVLDKDD